MGNIVKKHAFLLPFARIFTRGMQDAYESILFNATESFGDETYLSLAAPVSWTPEAVSVMAEAAHPCVPADLRANEENTVPSWLWRHKHIGPRREAEADLRDIFNRCVGSAAAKAWKLGLFSSETHARAFFEETRFALMNRHIAIAPEVLAPWGVNWAYGIDETPRRVHSTKISAAHHLSNTSIDAMIERRKDPTTAPLWKKLFAVRSKECTSVDLRLTDITADWQSVSPNPARAAIDLLALRHNDGTVNIDALRQTARILTVLLDLQERGDVTISVVNLAPLLMALGLAYDSDAARAMAASITALVTAECVATSAEMASLRTMSTSFVSNRDAIMRSLRNHRRAAFGDSNDYEKLSVLPDPLPLKNCPDLSLAAEAQRRWSEAVDWAHSFGLRAIQATDMTASPVLSVLTSGASQGLEPMPRLTILRADASGTLSAEMHPAILEAFARMDYAKTVIDAAKQNIVGAGSVRKAPHINASTLKARGLDDVAIEKIESYIPCVNSLKLAITPWVLGVDYCVSKLKIPAQKFDTATFSLLKHLGFSQAQIDEADLYCYGCGSVRNAKSVPLRHRPVFARGDEVSTHARVRMAAAVQSFISGDTGLKARLSTADGPSRAAEVTLMAWSAGIKSLTIDLDPHIAPRPVAKSASRKIKAKPQAHAKTAEPSRKKASGKRMPVVSAKKTATVRRSSR